MQPPFRLYYYKSIKITFRKTSHYLKISVADTGIGIDKDDISHIFDCFYMADKARTNTASSGLGLYITKQAVDELGGIISVRSKVNKGSKFVVCLPLDETDMVLGIKTSHIDALRKKDKLAIWFFCGLALTFIYRFMKYSETRQKTTLYAALLFMPLFPLGWLIDLTEILFTNTITFLAK